MLTYVQHNSDTHLVKIGINGRYNSGIALLYVWAHDLLGLNLMIEESGSSDVMYGGPVEDDKQVMMTIGEEDSISLLRRNSSEESRTSFYGRNTGEEVFRVTLQQQQDITISLPRPALGSGYQLMAMRGHRGPDGTVSGNFLNNMLFECDSMLARLGLAYQDGIDRTKGAINLLFPGLEVKVHSSSSKTTQGDGSNTSRRVDRLAIRLSDLKEASRKVSKPNETCKDSDRCMASWLAAFSCLESPATAKDLPIHLGHLHQSAIEKVQAPITTIQRLLQHDFDDASDRCVGNTLGISWSGWTCLTTGMELPDPAGVRNGQLSVLRGTPVVDDTPRRLQSGRYVD